MEFDPSKIVSLHNHGSFSVLDGLSSYDDIVALAVERGQIAAAITEHGNISGVAEFYHKCKDAGIKPLIGEEFYITPENRLLTDREAEFDKRRHHITILAKNDAGYKNLCFLSTIAKTKGDYYKPRIDLPTLFEHKEGLIVLSGCIVSQLNYYVESYLGNNGNSDPEGLEKARKYLQKMKEEFADDFYIEQVWLRPTGVINENEKAAAGENYLSIIDRQNAANEVTKKLAQELGIKRVMTGDAHYARPEHKESHETLLCIGTASDKKDPKRLTFIDQDLSIPSAEDMYNHAKELNDFELVETQGEIIDKITLDLKLGEQGYRVPKFPVPEGIMLNGKEIKTEAEYLRYLTYEGYKKKKYAEKWKDKIDEVNAEIKKELEVIDKMGFNGYFLIVQEYVNWARANGVLVGPGRGSAAGSVVVFLIGITSIDPMDYPDLMIFERFLNPDRYSMPDIDMDFSDRQKVEDHLVELYGRDQVCAIQTITRMRARQVFKDVARTERFDYMESNKVASLIPELAGEAAKTNRLQSEVENNKDLQLAIKEYPELEGIFKEAIPLEGNVRGYGVHAAGVIISDQPLTNYIGLFMSKDDRIVQQCDSTQVEADYGLLKMDLLGLANLSVMDECIKNVNKRYGHQLNSPDDIPIDDEATYDLICRGDSKFTFQFNSPLMRHSAKNIQPRCLADLALLVAVVRPGPLQFLDEIIAVRNGAEREFTKEKEYPAGSGKIVSYHPIELTEPKIKAIVDQTHGHVVYQEQLMRICTTCCGFTMGQADKVRKAMGKSKPSELAKYRPDFINGFLKNTDSTKELEISIFWDELLELAKYCFNGSHSVCYSTIGYQTAYLLTHYPEEYLAAYMNIKKDNKDEIDEVIAYAKQRGITISTPDVKIPGFSFTPGDKKIVYGLTAVKGIGESAVKRIIEVMSGEDAPSTVEEFLNAFERKELNTRVLTALIYSGALDSLITKEEKERQTGFDNFAPRVILANNLENILRYREEMYKTKKGKVSKKQASLLEDLFGAAENHLILGPNTSILTIRDKKEKLIELLLKEKEMIGSFITYNPAKLYTPKDGDKFAAKYEIACQKLKELKEGKVAGKTEDRGNGYTRDRIEAKYALIKNVVIRILSYREILTKKDKRVMYFTQMEIVDENDKAHIFEGTVFPNEVEALRDKQHATIKDSHFFKVDLWVESEENFIINNMKPLG